jgi:hypothetical protein
MPGVDRNILKSLMAHTRVLLQSPPAASGLASFSIYNENDLIAINGGAPLPEWPFVFLLDSYMRPKPGILPMIILEIPTVHRIPFEIGNRDGRTTDAILHCFGKTRGMVLDLSSFFVDYLGNTFPVYSYVSGPTGDIGSFVENAELEPDILSEPFPRRLTSDMRWEGTLDLWRLVSFRFRTKH